jgi:hypothetical protein
VLLQVVKRLTGMASREESGLFELYKQVCMDDGAVAVTCTQSLRLQVEIPSKLKALIEKLEGEHDDSD